MRVLIFGDSIIQGFNDPEGGWVERLKRDYMRRHVDGISSLEIFNLGVSGDTSKDVLRRIKNEIIVRRWPNDPVMTVLAVGVNDSADKLGKRLCPIDQYEANINEILKIMSETSDKQMVIGLTPCVDTLLSPASWSENDFYAKNQRIHDYEKVLGDVAQSHSVEFMPLWEKFTILPDWETMFPDGLHPNDVGHRMIYNQVKIRLDQQLIP